MGFGKKHSLKTSKADETVPSGAAYNSEYFHSIQYKADTTKARKHSTFGIDMDQVAKVIYPGQERHHKGFASPGPGIYSSVDHISKSL